MEIKFTKEQYKNLLKLIYLGNWMINAIRLIDERIKKYDDIEQYIFSFAKDADLEKYILFDKELNQFFPTREFEEDTDIEQYRQGYDNEIFWEELIHRLAWRNLIKKYGREAIKKMEPEERIEKEQPFIEKYAKEFEQNGIDNLDILKKLDEIL